jgi:hypothetical protein
VEVKDSVVLVGRLYRDVTVPRVLGLRVAVVVVFGATVVESGTPS